MRETTKYQIKFDFDKLSILVPSLRDERLPGAGRPEHHDVGLLQLELVLLSVQDVAAGHRCTLERLRHSNPT